MCSSITISSSDALPARSPIPLIAHSTWRQPASRPASELATAMPRSSWQCTETTTSRRSGHQPVQLARTSRRTRAASCSRRCPGTLIVLAPSSSAIWITSAMYSTSEREPSSGENSTSSVYSRACATAARTCPLTSSRVVCSLRSMWMSLVAMNVWMRGRSRVPDGVPRRLDVLLARARQPADHRPFDLAARSPAPTRSRPAR